MTTDGDLIQSIPSEQEDSETPLRPYDILSYPADFTLEVLAQKWDRDEIRIPTLQRRYVWNQVKASKLIESFLMGLPVPPVFLYQSRRDSGLLVIDGHQRLRSIIYFISGYFGDPKSGKKIPTFSLAGLSKRSPFADVTYKMLESDDPSAFNRFKNSVLRAIVMKQVEPNDDTSVYEVFERLNTGGMILQGQEVRNCIYEGSFNGLLKELNSLDAWREIIGRKPEDKRMRDVELILRFFALFYNAKHYEKPMKGFLNEFMYKNQHLPEAKREEFRKLFVQTAEAIRECLGERPFRIKGGVNVAVYDSVFTAFAKHLKAVEKIKADKTKTKQIRARLRNLKANKQYLEWVLQATTDKEVVPKRIKKAEQILFG